MRKTSLKAFERIRKTLSGRRQMVAIKILQKPGSTIRDVAKAMKTYPNCISGRFSELCQLGVIKEAGIKKYGKNNIPHTKWEVIIK
jgi:hypothetical protein